MHVSHAVKVCPNGVPLHLVLGKLSTACPVLAMAIKDPKEHLFWVACKAPICTDRVLHKMRHQ